MRARTHLLPLALLLAFTVLLPAFWMIDIAQASAARAQDPAQSEILTGPRSASPGLTAPSDRPELIESKDVTQFTAPPVEAEQFQESAVLAPGDEEPVPEGAIPHLVPASHGGAAFPAAEIRLPELSRGAAHRLSRLLLPLAPALEVPTTPPLLAI